MSMRSAGPAATSLLVLIPGLFLMSLGTAFADTQNLVQYNEQWIVLAVVGFFVSIAVFAVLGIPVRFVRGVWRVPAVNVLFALTELARTLVVENMAIDRGLLLQVNWTAQIITGILTGVTVYGIASLAVNEAREFRATAADLESRSPLLQSMLARMELDLALARREIVTSAKDKILGALNGIIGPRGRERSVEALITSLLQVSDNVVRPLSRELLYRPGRFSGVVPTVVARRLRFREILELASTTEPFRPGASVMVAGLLALGAAVTREPIGLGIVALAAFLATAFGVLALERRILRAPLRAISFWPRFVVINTAYLVVCLPSSLAVGYFNSLPVPTMLAFLGYSVLLGFLILWYLAVMAGLRRGYSGVIEQLAEVNRLLEWTVARENARLWTEQKELSRILHNEIQGILVATAFKLRRDLEDGVGGSVDLESVRREVRHLMSLSSSESFTPPLETFLALERERWLGVMEITWDVDKNTVSRINHDWDTRRVISDLVGEFMTNAVKHGGAHVSTIWMRETPRHSIDVSLYNDGLPMPADRTPGLGVKLAHSISVSLSLPPRETGIELRVEIPCEEMKRQSRGDAHGVE